MTTKTLTKRINRFLALVLLLAALATGQTAWAQSGPYANTIEVDGVNYPRFMEFDAYDGTGVEYTYELYWPQSGASIGAQRAYFQLNGLTAGGANSGASDLNIVLNLGDGEVTGIIPPSISPKGENPEASPWGGLVGVWYTLDGRKIVHGTSSNGKLPKGVYIVNGRKVVVK